MIFRICALTLTMGVAVVVSWIAVRGSSVFEGPGPLMDASWLAVWAIQAVLVFGLGLFVGRRWGREASSLPISGLILAAWFGELIVATLLVPLLAGELSLVAGPFVWLIATGGVIQPLVAIVGAVVGRGSIRSSAQASTG